MKFSKRLFPVAFMALLAAAPGSASNANTSAPVEQAALEKNVNRALETLASDGLFDILSYRVDSEFNVTLTGQVARPVVSRDAVAAVRNVAGVRSVDNQIEVLPLSPFDDNVRLRAYAAIFAYPALSRYAINARPPIRILVKNGDVTLDGVVATELDSKLIEMRVRSLGGIFQVTNRLKVEGRTT